MSESASKRPRKKRWGLDEQGDSKEEMKLRLWAIANKLSLKLGFPSVDPSSVPKPAPAPLSCVLSPFSGLPLYPAPGTLVAGQRKQRKIYVPTGPLPAGKGLATDTNYLGLLIGPRGATQKTMEQDSGAKILIRGRGSSKDGNDMGETEDLHVLIMGDTDAQVDKAAELVEDLLFNVDKREKIKTVQLRQVAELSNDGRPVGVVAPVVKDSTTTKEIYIPQDRVGLVIGKGGETIKQLQMSTGCHIQIARESAPDNMRAVTIGGTEEQIARAEVEVYYVIDKEGRFTPPAVLAYAATGVVGGAPIAARAGIGFDAKDDIIINIPQNMVGLLIGKGGETIRQLQEKTGAHIQVTKDSESDPQSGTRAVRLGGFAQQIEHVRKEIDMLIENQIRGNPGLMLGPTAKVGVVGPDGSRTIPVYVPGAHVGVVIGRGGETIKRLQAQTGARIQVSKDDSGTEREIILCGSDYQLEFAKREIEALVKEAVGRDSMRTPVIPRGNNYSNAGQPTTMTQKLQQIAQEKQAAMAAAYDSLEKTFADPGTAAVPADPYAAYYYPATGYYPGFGTFGETAVVSADGKEGDANAAATAAAQAAWSPEQWTAYYAYYGYTFPVSGMMGMNTTDATATTLTSPSSFPVSSSSDASSTSTTSSTSITPSTSTTSSSSSPVPSSASFPPLSSSSSSVSSSSASPASPSSSPFKGPSPPPVPAPPPMPPLPQGMPPLPQVEGEQFPPPAHTWMGSPPTFHFAEETPISEAATDEKEKIVKEKAEKIRVLKEKIEKEKLEAERIERERIEKERLDREKVLRDAILKRPRGNSVERQMNNSQTKAEETHNSDGNDSNNNKDNSPAQNEEEETAMTISSTKTESAEGQPDMRTTEVEENINHDQDNSTQQTKHEIPSFPQTERSSEETLSISEAIESSISPSILSSDSPLSPSSSSSTPVDSSQDSSRSTENAMSDTPEP